MILIVDDDEETNWAISRICSDIGVEAITARQLDYAMDMLKENPIKLVLCDLMFDGDMKAGFEFVRRAKAIGTDALIAIVSSVPESMAGNDARSIGVEFIPKPISADAVKSLLVNIKKQDANESV